MNKYNALVREYSGRSLNVLSRVLIADIKDFPDDWQIRYNSQIIDNSTTEVGDLCCGPLNPLQIYLPAKAPFPISVRTLTGKCLDIEVSKKDTVDVLKLKIFQKDDTLEPPLQRLYFHGNENPKESLWVWRTLDYYKISGDSTVFLRRKATFSESLAPNAAAPTFAPINVKATYQKHGKKPLQAEDRPLWVRYSAGISFCGLCPNSGCASKMSGRNERQVVGNVMCYGTARLERLQKQLICPACSNPGVGVTSLLISQARVVICYKSGAVDENGVQISVESVGTDLYREVLMEKKMNFVEITSVEPWRSPYNCMGCDAKIALKSEEVRLNCEHAYHTWCHSKSDGCLVCGSNVLIVGSAKDVILAYS